jgi:hypothetical protein
MKHYALGIRYGGKNSSSSRYMSNGLLMIYRSDALTLVMRLAYGSAAAFSGGAERPSIRTERVFKKMRKMIQ